MQRLGDQLLADVRPVAVGGVDQVDAELDGPPQDGDRGVVIGRRAPDALAGDAHGAEAEAMDLEVAAEGEGAAERHRARAYPLAAHRTGR